MNQWVARREFCKVEGYRAYHLLAVNLCIQAAKRRARG
jgi:hypothetical protein